MGGICWPTRDAVTAAPQVGSAKLERQLAYQGNPVGVTVLGIDGRPYTGAVRVVLTERGTGSTVTREAVSGAFSTAGVPAAVYRVAVGGVPAGNLRVL